VSGLLLSNPSIEQQKLALEERRLVLEERRVKRERLSRWITPLAIFVPLLVAALTYVGNVTTQARHDRQQLELQERQGQQEFELTAAEVVMKVKTPKGTQQRARALAALFPQRLPEGFGDTFRACKFQTGGCTPGGVGGKYALK
jgi:hypothetical protein